MIRIGVLTPHAAIGPEEEFPAMAPGRLVTRVVRVLNDDAPLLGDAAQMLATDPVDVVGYASTTSAYAVGFDEETAMVSRLSALLDLPVAATCASAVLALRVLHVERVALVGAPWFDPELNELGAAYFRSQGFDVVSSASAELSRDPQRIDPAAVQAWTSRHIGDEAEGSSSAATASERREQSPGWRPRSAARFSPRIRSCSGISSHRPALQPRSSATVDCLPTSWRRDLVTPSSDAG